MAGRERKMLAAVFLAVGLSCSAEGLSWAASPAPDLAVGVAHYIVGVSAELAGDSEAARRAYARSVEADGTRFASRFRLALLDAQAGDMAAARRGFTAAAAIAPVEDLRARYFLALFNAGKDPDKASLEYEKILKALSEKDPANSDVLITLGELYHALGRTADALVCVEKAWRISPDDPALMYLLGDYYLEAGRRGKGEILLKRCLAADPMAAGCLNSLSFVYAQDGRELNKAARLVRRALLLDPKNPAYLDTRGWVAYRLGNARQALTDLLEADGLAKAPEILDHIAQVYLKIGRSDLAREYWQEALGIDKDLPDIKAKLKELDKKESGEVEGWKGGEEKRK